MFKPLAEEDLGFRHSSSCHR